MKTEVAHSTLAAYASKLRQGQKERTDVDYFDMSKEFSNSLDIRGTRNVPIVCQKSLRMQRCSYTHKVRKS